MNKKAMSWIIISWLILSSTAFWMYDPERELEKKDSDYQVQIENRMIKPVPTLMNEIGNKELLSDLQKKYSKVINNNRIESDYEYNSENYFTSKIKTDDLIIPDEIKNNASKIYFLIEEWHNYIMYKNEWMLSDSITETPKIEDEYNYKIIDITDYDIQDEYIFQNSELVKDFDKKETNKSVNIKLVAVVNWEDLILSNYAYVNVSSKENVLNNHYNKMKDNNYYSYYNISVIEKYLEDMSKDMERSKYKEMLETSLSKINTLSADVKSEKTIMLDSINKESDFKLNLDKYISISEKEKLYNSLNNALNRQLQNVRSYDAIDSIFNK